MSQTPFITGLGRGRARGRRDIAESEPLAERRPGRFRATWPPDFLLAHWEGELAGSQSDMESNWKSVEDSAPGPLQGCTLTGAATSTQSWPTTRPADPITRRGSKRLRIHQRRRANRHTIQKVWGRPYSPTSYAYQRAASAASACRYTAIQ